MDEAQVQAFWEAHPCDDHQVGGLHEAFAQNYEDFFRRYDEFRYASEAHILRCLDDIDFKGKRVLEIGLGQGADSEQIIRRGATWSGLDLTAASVARVRTRLTLHNLPHEALKLGSALNIPYADDSFDIVFSHGVLHHIPDIQMAQAEIARVLRPNGELVVMLYAKWSLNYLLAIGLLRRLGLFLLYALRVPVNGIYKEHLENVRRAGLRAYLKMSTFVHKNTDGPYNPYSKVYDLAEVRQDFSAFQIMRSYKRFMHAPPLPVSWLPLESVMGWHLWVHLKPRKSLSVCRHHGSEPSCGGSGVSSSY